MDPINIEVFRSTPYSYQFHATGQVYHAWYELGSLAAGATIYYELRQTRTDIAHILDYIVKSDSTNIEMEIYRGATFTPGTVRMNWHSYNHRIDKAPSVELYQDPTGVNVAGATTTFKTKGFGPAQGGQVSFADVAPKSFLEEMLAESEDYIIGITNNGASAREAFFHLAWYESGN